VTIIYNVAQDIVVKNDLKMRRPDMPGYDFKCEKCQKKFSLSMSISEYENTKLKCPKCKSSKVKQQISHFQTKTSRKS
jgi:putative FmdB family regulatory protein